MDNNQLAQQIEQVFNNALQARIADRVEQRVQALVRPSVAQLEKVIVGRVDIYEAASLAFKNVLEQLHSMRGNRGGPGPEELFRTEVGGCNRMKALNYLLYNLGALIEDAIRESVMKEEVAKVVEDIGHS